MTAVYKFFSTIKGTFNKTGLKQDIKQRGKFKRIKSFNSCFLTIMQFC